MNIKTKVKELKTNIPALLIYLKMKGVPILPKLFCALIVGYALSPIDLIPDFIPILGYLDDIILLPLLISLVIRMIPHEIFVKCQQSAQNISIRELKSWFFGIPIIILWIFCIYLIMKLIL